MLFWGLLLVEQRIKYFEQTFKTKLRAKVVAPDRMNLNSEKSLVSSDICHHAACAGFSRPNRGQSEPVCIIISDGDRKRTGSRIATQFAS